MAHTDFDLDTLALTLYGECRGETIEGQYAVAWVIKNRWLNPGWWSRNRDSIPDDTIAAVCRDPYQFSCWNPADPNSAKLCDSKTLEKPEVQRLRNIGKTVLNEPIIADPTKGSDHYCTTKIAKYTKWAKGRKPVVIVGNHSFYKLGLS